MKKYLTPFIVLILTISCTFLHPLVGFGYTTTRGKIHKFSMVISGNSNGEIAEARAYVVIPKEKDFLNNEFTMNLYESEPKTSKLEYIKSVHYYYTKSSVFSTDGDSLSKLPYTSFNYHNGTANIDNLNEITVLKVDFTFNELREDEDIIFTIPIQTSPDIPKNEYTLKSNLYSWITISDPLAEDKLNVPFELEPSATTSTTSSVDSDTTEPSATTSATSSVDSDTTEPSATTSATSSVDSDTTELSATTSTTSSVDSDTTEPSATTSTTSSVATIKNINRISDKPRGTQYPKTGDVNPAWLVYLGIGLISITFVAVLVKENRRKNTKNH